MSREKQKQMRELIEAEKGALREMRGEGDFVRLIGVIGIVAAFYLVWPVEGWIEGVAAFFGGAFVGGIVGKTILAMPGGRFLVSAASTIIRLGIVVVVIGALIYFVQNN